MNNWLLSASVYVLFPLTLFVKLLVSLYSSFMKLSERHEIFLCKGNPAYEAGNNSLGYL